MGKWYINNSKTKEKPILFFDFLSIFQRKQWGRNLECLDEEFIMHSGMCIQSDSFIVVPLANYLITETSFSSLCNHCNYVSM